MPCNPKCLFMTTTIDDPEFLASWQKVEGCLKCLDANQVERLFSKEYASLSDFHQALADEMKFKEASLKSVVTSLKAENEAIKKETLEMKSKAEKLREERMAMEEELAENNRQIAALRNSLKTNKLDNKK
mgnify:FL=1